MNKLLFLLSLGLAEALFAQIIDPVKLDLAGFAGEYLPVIERYDSDYSSGSGSSSVVIREIDSPHGTKKIVINEESDLMLVGSGETVAKATVVEGDATKLTITVEQYGRFEIEWLNEELFQIVNWPGRCISLYTIYSTIEERVIYEAGFNHCGV